MVVREVALGRSWEKPKDGAAPVTGIAIDEIGVGGVQVTVCDEPGLAMKEAGGTDETIEVATEESTDETRVEAAAAAAVRNSSILELKSNKIFWVDCN